MRSSSGNKHQNICFLLRHNVSPRVINSPKVGLRAQISPTYAKCEVQVPNTNSHQWQSRRVCQREGIFRGEEATRPGCPAPCLLYSRSSLPGSSLQLPARLPQSLPPALPASICSASVVALLPPILLSLSPHLLRFILLP